LQSSRPLASGTNVRTVPIAIGRLPTLRGKVRRRLRPAAERQIVGRTWLRDGALDKRHVVWQTSRRSPFFRPRSPLVASQRSWTNGPNGLGFLSPLPGFSCSSSACSSGGWTSWADTTRKRRPVTTPPRLIEWFPVIRQGVGWTTSRAQCSLGEPGPSPSRASEAPRGPSGNDPESSLRAAEPADVADGASRRR
jgi:hypothetical protein